MIEETKKKIHFMPYSVKKGRVKDTNKPPTASVAMKYSRLTWGKKAIRDMGMGGKFVRLYFEPNRKIIGWRITDKLSEAELKSKVWRLCNPAPSTGVWHWSIKGMLDQMKLKEDHTYKDLEIKRYREMGIADQYSGEVFYFIEVKEDNNEC